jgi:SP family myo-inositol transporter-like MFS transporter 13
MALLGYDTGVISGALVTIGSDLGPEALSNGQKVNFLKSMSV